MLTPQDEAALLRIEQKAEAAINVEILSLDDFRNEPFENIREAIKRVIAQERRR